jgi:subtilisin-like proprotein convertase family protein
VAALMLQANPLLGWRDVQDIMALTARHVGTAINNGKSGYEVDTWAFNHATNVNGGGMHFSNDYGYGLVDAAAAVRLAQSWNLVHGGAGTSATEIAASASYASATALDVGHGRTTTLSFNIGTHESVESMVLDLNNLKFNHSNDLTVTLTSPTGTVSQLLTNNGGTSASAITAGWELMSREFLGEDAYGKWTVSITSSSATDVGSLSSAKLTAYGSNIAYNSVEYYTDEFATYANADASRVTVGSGISAIDAAAITGACNVNFATKVASIDGKAISLGTANVTTVVGGAGNDTLVASNAGAKLYGGQGNDILVGGTANDYLDGGANTNTIATGSGKDNVLMHLRGMDNIVDFSVNSDHLMLSRSEFTAFANGRAVNSLDFLTVSGTSASTHVMGGGLIYDTAAGNLYYDADGHSALSLIAHLNNNTKLTTADLALVA